MLKQCTKLVCKKTFSFKCKRIVTFCAGQEFWVTNFNQKQGIEIARKNQPQGTGYLFAPETVKEYFSLHEKETGEYKTIAESFFMNEK